MAVPIYHITREEEWEEAQNAGAYAPDSLKVDGFIHCSYAHQLERVANASFAGQPALLVLRIDPTLLAAEVRLEPVEPEAEGTPRFPHVYGAIEVTAVTSVWKLEPASDGRFHLPADI